MKPTLLIIELDYHAEVLSAICSMLETQFILRLWTTKKIWAKTGLSISDFASVSIMPRKVNFVEYFQMNPELRQADLVYLNTLEKNITAFLELSLPQPKIVRIHNLNTSFFPKKNISWRNPVKTCLFLIKRVFKGKTWQKRRQFYQSADGLMLPSNAILETYSKTLKDDGFSKITPFCIPFSALGEKIKIEDEIKNQKKIVVSITGSIDPKRKDFKVLLRSIQLFKKRYPDQNLHIQFLGRPKNRSGRRILESFKKLVDSKFTIYHSDHYISDTDFANALKKSHFILAPILLKTEFQIYKEVYGKTKVSGVEADMVRHRKPAILPYEYNVSPALKPFVMTYRNAENLCDAIYAMKRNDNWLKLSLQYDDLSSYEKSNIACTLFDYYQKVLLKMQPAHQTEK